MIYKFVKHKIPELETDTEIYKLHEKLITNKKKPTRADKDWLFRRLQNHDTRVLLHGYAFSFREILKKYWVQFYYEAIFTYYACDKTSIRNEHTGITKIVEVK